MRAIGSLIAIGAVAGAALLYLGDRVLPLLSPTLAGNEFGEGYRRGKRETELELRVQELEATIQIMENSARIDEEINSMSEEEINKLLTENGEFRPEEETKGIKTELNAL